MPINLEFSESVGFIHKECHDARSYDRKNHGLLCHSEHTKIKGGVRERQRL